MGEVHDQLERARSIVAAGGIEEIAPNIWSVPSQSGTGVYLVSLRGTGGCASVRGSPILGSTANTWMRC